VSRIASNPIVLPDGIKISIDGQTVTVVGSKGKMTYVVHDFISVYQKDNCLNVVPNKLESYSRSHVTRKSFLRALSGTMRALLNNIVIGVTQGFRKKLLLVGVGYRVQKQSNKLILSLGFSHTINYTLPEGITAEIPNQTEIEIIGIDKQLVGQVAAEIRSFRPPEPYKGKGVRYANEVVILKETKKK